MGTTPDVLVIGGGIIGLTSAYYLAKAGLAVEVVDRGAFGREASWAGAGIIPPGNPDRAATPIDKLRAIGSAKYPELSAELRERTGIANGYLRCGGVEFLGPDDQYVLDVWRDEGIAFERLTPDGLRRLEPSVTTRSGEPYLLPDCAQVRNPWHLRALIEACRSVGVRLTPNAPISLMFPDVSGECSAVFTPDMTFRQAGEYLVTTGAWAGDMIRHHFELDLRISPVRGQIVLFNSGRQVITRVLMAGKRYLVPRADGRVLAGSTEEPEAGFEKSNTPEGVQGLTRFAHELVPVLRDAEVEATWAGLRPGSPDGLPYIGRVPGFDNVLVAAGHFRAGVQLSIGTAELVRDLITGRPPAVPADAFRLDREPDQPVRPAFRS